MILIRQKKIIDYIEKNKEFSSINKNSINEEEISKEIDNKDNKKEICDDEECEKLKKELDDTEKYALELKDKKDKFVKQSLGSSTFNRRRSIQTYSGKLMRLYSNKEQLCELSSEENSSQRCNCSMERLKNCFIY